MMMNKRDCQVKHTIHYYVNVHLSPTVREKKEDSFVKEISRLNAIKNRCRSLIEELFFFWQGG